MSNHKGAQEVVDDGVALVVDGDEGVAQWVDSHMLNIVTALKLQRRCGVVLEVDLRHPVPNGRVEKALLGVEHHAAG